MTDVKEILEKQILELYEHTLSLTKLNEDLRQRVERLEGERNLAIDFINDTIAIQTALWLAERDLDFKDSLLKMGDVLKPPDHIDSEVVAAGFEAIADYLRNPDKKIMPDWFKGVIQGKNDEPGAE